MSAPPERAGEPLFNTSVLNILRTDDGDSIHPDLERRVADEIRRYPVWDAPSWLAPVAAILAVEEWLTEHGLEVRASDE